MFDTVQPVPSSGNTISFSMIERSSKLEVLKATPDKAISLSDIDKDENSEFNAVELYYQYRSWYRHERRSYRQWLPARIRFKISQDGGDVSRSKVWWRVKIVFVLALFIVFSNQISMFGIIFVGKIALFTPFGKELDISLDIILFVYRNISYCTKALWLGVLEL